MRSVETLDSIEGNSKCYTSNTIQEKCYTTDLLSDCGGETKVNNAGAPGWLSRLSVGLLISAQVTISGLWDWALHWTPCWVRGLLKIPPLSPSLPHVLSLLLYFFKDFIYLFMRDREREREREAGTQAEGEAGSMQGARRGTQSWVSRIMPWAEDGTKRLSHPGCPAWIDFNGINFYYKLKI